MHSLLLLTTDNAPKGKVDPSIYKRYLSLKQFFNHYV